MSATDFSAETARKDQLLTLLEKHEKEIKFKPQDKNLKYGFYDRVFNGVAEVEKVGQSSLRLKRENGRPLGVLLVTPEIADLAKKKDHILAMLGHRMGQWHLMQIRMIGSHVKNGNGEKQMHLSISGQNLREEVCDLEKEEGEHIVQ